MRSGGTLEIPEADRNRQPVSTPEQIDQYLRTVSDASATWVSTRVEDRVGLLAECRANVASVAREWVEAACAAKGITLGTPTEGEEWQSGPWVTLRNLRLLERSLRDIAAGGLPKLPGNLRRAISGQVTVPVFPTDNWDRALFTGFSAEVWMEPGLTVTDVIDLQAWAYRDPPEPAVSVVLGAGNIASIAPTDMLYELFANLRTVVLKMNPVNEYLGPILERGFAPLVDAGLLRFVYGGVAVGKHLTEHPDVAHIHMTGSDKTHDAIVFGTGESGATAKSADTPVTDKSISAELGNVTPVIVVPGPWTDKDLAYQAKNLAAMLAHNAGFNCIATRVIIQSETWQHRVRLLDEVAAVLENIPPRLAYYPGAIERLETFVDAHETARMIGAASDGRLPWTLIPALEPKVSDDICFTTESFASLMSEVGLPESDPAKFIDLAVEFCNSTLWGSLGASIIVHPKSLADPAISAAIDSALENLAYGTIAINQWSGFGFVIGSSPWGAHPGHQRTDIQSGTGVVHNTYLLSGSQKTVIRGPWRVTPKPTWFPDHRSANMVLEHLTYFEASPSFAKLAKVITASLRG